MIKFRFEFCYKGNDSLISTLTKSSSKSSSRPSCEEEHLYDQEDAEPIYDKVTFHIPTESEPSIETKAMAPEASFKKQNHFVEKVESSQSLNEATPRESFNIVSPMSDVKDAKNLENNETRRKTSTNKLNQVEAPVLDKSDISRWTTRSSKDSINLSTMIVLLIMFLSLLIFSMLALNNFIKLSIIESKINSFRT